MDKIKTLSELVEYVSKIEHDKNNILVFRGAKKDYKETALDPLVYRYKYIENEDKIYRESQRFNDHEFSTDKTAFDKLSRIQHYSAPTRVLDVCEDLFSAVYFAIGEKEPINNNESEEKKTDAIIYILEIDNKKIKYYDSDAVSVISNLAKIPLTNDKNEKSKEALFCDIKKYRDKIKKFNKQKSAKFLLHEIKEEKPQFEPIINPKHLTSVQFVLPKLTNNRVRSQKGAFLLFGLNPDNFREPIKLVNEKGLIESNENINHPIVKLHKAVLDYDSIFGTMKDDLIKMGIKTSFIFPEIDKVSEELINKYKDSNAI